MNTRVEQHPGHHHDSAHGGSATALAHLLDLDAEVCHGYLDELTGWLRRLAGPRRRILDLGAGTGAGTVRLAQRFRQAEVVAVDASPSMLARVRAKASDLGLGDRVQTVQADVDATWPDLEPVDVAWASNVLHEVADPARVLAQVLGTLRPGGLLAVAEMQGHPQFFAHPGGGGSGLEARIADALRGPALPSEQSHPDWGAVLARAGFSVLATRTFTVDLTRGRSASLGRYAQAYLRHLRPLVEDRLAPGDRAGLDALLDSEGSDGVLHRADLHLRSTRTAWIARRS